MENYPRPVTREEHRKISEYFDDLIYEIKGDKGKKGKGIFCLMKIHNKKIYTLITSYNMINEEYLKKNNNIEIIKDKEVILIEMDYIYYINKELDISVIQIKENKKIRIIDIDENVYNNESEMYYLKKESIYIIYNKNVSYGIINNITSSELILGINLKNIDLYKYPIINLTTNQLIGIYYKNSKYYNKGIYIKYIINELQKKYNKNDIKNIFNNDNNNEIKIKIEIKEKDINKEIYFLDNEYEENNIIKSGHNNIKELNERNTELYINNNKYNYKKYIKPKEIGEYYNIK